MIYDGDLTVLDKDGELVSWASSDLLAMMWGDEEGEEGELPPVGAGGGGDVKTKMIAE